MPDIMANDIPTEKPDFNYLSWFPRHPVSVADNIVEKTIKYMKNEMGIKKIGVVGYCYGGKYAVRTLKQGGGVDAVFVAHPTLLESAELEAVTGPLSIAAAGTFFCSYLQATCHSFTHLEANVPIQYRLRLCIQRDQAARG
jgi:dienelactone hydrolase